MPLPADHALQQKADIVWGDCDAHEESAGTGLRHGGVSAGAGRRRRW